MRYSIALGLHVISILSIAIPGILLMTGKMTSYLITIPIVIGFTILIFAVIPLYNSSTREN